MVVGGWRIWGIFEVELGAGVQNNVLGCGEFGALLRWPQEASNGVVGSGEFGVF